MDFWDGLQMYDLVNDGDGNYGFTRPNRRNNEDGWFKEQLACEREISRIKRNIRRFKKQAKQGLTSPE